MTTIAIRISHNNTRHHFGQWTAYVPGAMGTGRTPWTALADALVAWARRGRPEQHEGVVADWVITKVVDKGRGQYYRFHVEGENLNMPVEHGDPGGLGRSIRWSVHDLSDPRYEFVGEAAEVAALVRREDEQR